MMMMNYDGLIWDLGKYRPEVEEHDVMGPGLTAHVARFGVRAFNWHIRNPSHNVQIWTDDENVKTWHMDPRDQTGPQYILLWATRTPTEIRLPDGFQVQPEDHTVILLNNRCCEHRVPIHIDMHNRWWARGWDVVVPRATYKPKGKETEGETE